MGWIGVAMLVGSGVCGNAWAGEGASEAAINRLERENANLASQIKVLQNRLSNGKSSRGAAKAPVAPVDDGTAARLNAEVSKLQKALKAALQKQQDLSARLKQRESGNQRLDGMLSTQAKQLEVTVNENRDLAEQLMASLADQSHLSSELKALQKQTKSLERTITKLTETVEDDKAKIAELEADLDVAKTLSRDAHKALEKKEDMARDLEKDVKRRDGDIADLKEDVAKEQADLAEREAELKKIRAEAETLQKDYALLKETQSDVRNSDLFKQVEKANLLLRDKVVELEEERHRLAKENEKLKKRDAGHDREVAREREKRDEAEQKLKEARRQEEDHAKVVRALSDKVPALEKQIVELSTANLLLAQKMAEKEDSVRALKVEIMKREHRLDKAERVARVLEEARHEVIHVNDKEKRDMHYNMAAVYSKEGKYRDAEVEYLKALNLDPADADVHYNLAILYDDELKVPAKAIMHYRRYLKLNPHGPDADIVRDWLMKLEM